MWFISELGGGPPKEQKQITIPTFTAVTLQSALVWLVTQDLRIPILNVLLGKDKLESKLEGNVKEH